MFDCVLLYCIGISAQTTDAISSGVINPGLCIRIVLSITCTTVDSIPTVHDHPSIIGTALPKFFATIVTLVGLGAHDIFALGAARASHDVWRIVSAIG
jgi:hypothetical protein